jgi:glycosyltransferase involved in cell wall biosynthesis
MKITIVSIYFYPKIGGVENIMFGLANQWHEMGHSVTVFTATPGDDQFNFKVIRSLSLKQLFKEVRNSDIFFEANISLKTFWVGMINKKKWFVLHHLTYTHIQRWQEVLKNWLTYFSNNISASQYISRTLKGKGIVIPNFYFNDFVRNHSIKKDKDIVCVGRLVSDKGADDLIRALINLKERSSYPSCTIIGEGPELEKLLSMIQDGGLEKQVRLIGSLRGQLLVAEINAHKMMVVPSKWPEPFGVVVLEGFACGCRVVHSSDGGLTEAAHGLGVQYPNNDVVALADRIESTLIAGEYTVEEFTIVQKYLKTRTASVVAKRYLDLFSINKWNAVIAVD